MYLYVITATDRDLVKVGVSSDPHDRVKRLARQTGLSLALVYQSEDMHNRDAFTIEKFCHFALDDKHSHGEWFNYSALEAVALVEDALANGAATRDVPPNYIEPRHIVVPCVPVQPTLEDIARRGCYLALH